MKEHGALLGWGFEKSEMTSYLNEGGSLNSPFSTWLQLWFGSLFFPPLLSDAGWRWLKRGLPVWNIHVAPQSVLPHFWNFWVIPEDQL